MTEIKNFSRRRENFTCLVCGADVRGNGYTNHCPVCLCSRHVDDRPGDRLCTCGGIMPPVSLETKGGAYVLVHQCVRCGVQKRNKAAPEDAFDALCSLSNGTYRIYLDSVIKKS